MNTAPFHRALIRPLLLMGCDRELLMFSGLIAFALAAQGQTFISPVWETTVLSTRVSNYRPIAMGAHPALLCVDVVSSCREKSDVK